MYYVTVGLSNKFSQDDITKIIKRSQYLEKFMIHNCWCNPNLYSVSFPFVSITIIIT